MNSFCGLDFGTSNTTIGVSPNGQCQLIPLDNGKLSIRSAIFCDNEHKSWVFGQQGVDDYLEGVPGRLMMAIKSVLGSSLMEEETVVFNELVPYKKILGHFIKHIKSTAEQTLDQDLTQVVLGRPVRFDDNDDVRDRHAQNTLETIARDMGFKEILFQYEPIAAALAYETSIKSEQLALIVDMGGGTSDFTVIRLRPENHKMERGEDVLANCGVHIAGTDFDQRLSINSVMPLLGMGSSMRGSSSDIEVPGFFYHDLTSWHLLNNLYKAATINQVRSIQAVAYEKELIGRLIQVLQKKAGHQILNAVEKSKQRLSDDMQIQLDLAFIEAELATTISRQRLNESIEDQVQTILNTIQQTIVNAGVKSSDINAIFYTGGSSKIPLIREKINALFSQAEVVQGDAFGSVGLGLTIEAQRRFAM